MSTISLEPSNLTVLRSSSSSFPDFLLNRLKSGEISFDRNTAVYTAGESITGSLTIGGGSQGTRIYDLQITLINVHGVSHPSMCPSSNVLVKSWLDFCTVSRSVSDSSSVSVSYRFKESADQCVSIPRSEKAKLQFDLKLPESLWSTQIGEYGFLKYALVITGKESPCAAMDVVLIQKVIVIVGLVDGMRPEFDLPLTKTAKSVKVKAGEVTMSVTLRRRCGVPGQRLPFRVKIQNGSTLPLGSVGMILQQNVWYKFEAQRCLTRIRGRTRFYFALQVPDKEAKIYVQKEGLYIPPGPDRTVTWDGDFEIPYALPSGLGSEMCPLIDLQYVLQFVVAKFVQMKVQFEIHIGTALEVEDTDSVSLAYGLEMTRNLSLSQTSLISLPSDWSSTLDVPSQISSGSRRGSVPPEYESMWNIPCVESPPPTYEDATHKRKVETP